MDSSGSRIQPPAMQVVGDCGKVARVWRENGARLCAWARAVPLVGASIVLACSGPRSEPEPRERPSSDAPPVVDENAPAGDAPFVDFGAGNGSGGSGSPPASSAPSFGCASTVSGIALDPAGRLPLYNVVVYVPSEPLAPIARGASCETCDGNFSGRPIAATVSGATGEFHLDISRVPIRANIPLVIQAGKWRRQVTLAAAAECGDTRVPAELSRLPRHRGEGDLPQIAVMRAGSDALECLFTKIGVDPSEFTPGGAGGSVELYFSDLANATEQTGQMSLGNEVAALPNVDSLLSDFDELRRYDMVLMSCEGGDDRYDPPALDHRENLQRYADEGGRLFGGHFHNGIIDNRELPDDAPEFPDVVEFAEDREDIEPELFTAEVNQSFDKGRALAEWLVHVGGSSVLGEISINDSERTVESTSHPSAVSWIGADTSDGRAALYYGFPTPVDGPACGRMVFTDVHVASGSGDSGKEVFPSCSDELSPQQLALAFLIFDLASCVQPSEAAPPPPPVIY